VDIRPASDRSLLISFGDEISLAIHRQVVRLTHALQGTRGILNLHPAFTTLLIDFDPRLADHESIEALIHERTDHPAPESPADRRIVEIPVRFGSEFGPDLDDVAAHASLAPSQVIERFCAAEYEVYFVGFSTCFPYLGGLPNELATPRLRAPRKHVPAGSVGIAGAQAGVYPLASPGGWRLIGRTSLRLFDPSSAPPPLLRMSDRVIFHPEGGSCAV